MAELDDIAPIPPPPVPSTDDAGRLVDAFAALRAANAGALVRVAAASGATPTEFRALYFVAAGAATTPGELGRQLGLTTGATTNLLDRIEAAGLVRRTPNPADRRSVLLEATEEGLGAASASRRLWTEAFAAAVGERDAPAIAEALFRMAEQTDRIGT